jgi:hypothetical protein
VGHFPFPHTAAAAVFAAPRSPVGSAWKGISRYAFIRNKVLVSPSHSKWVRCGWVGPIFYFTFDLLVSFCAWLFGIKCSRWFCNSPDGLLHKKESFSLKENVFGAQEGLGNVSYCCDVTSLPIQKPSLLSAADSGARFSVSSTESGGAAMGVADCCGCFFWPNPAMLQNPLPMAGQWLGTLMITGGGGGTSP